MPVPKRKRSRARRDSRLAHKAIKVKATAICAQCQTTLVPHQACATCGYYKGVKVMTTKLDRAIKRGKVNEARKKRAPSAKSAAEQE